MNTTKEVHEQQQDELLRAQMADDSAEKKSDDSAEQEQKPVTTPEIAEALADYEKAIRRLQEIDGVTIFSSINLPTVNGPLKVATMHAARGTISDMVTTLLFAGINQPEMRRSIINAAELFSDPSKRDLFTFKYYYEKGVDPNILAKDLIKTVSYRQLFDEDGLVPFTPVTPETVEQLLKSFSRKGAEQTVAPETEQTPAQTE